MSTYLGRSTRNRRISLILVRCTSSLSEHTRTEIFPCISSLSSDWPAAVALWSLPSRVLLVASRHPRRPSSLPIEASNGATASLTANSSCSKNLCRFQQNKNMVEAKIWVTSSSKKHNTRKQNKMIHRFQQKHNTVEAK